MKTRGGQFKRLMDSVYGTLAGDNCGDNHNQLRYSHGVLTTRYDRVYDGFSVVAGTVLKPQDLVRLQASGEVADSLRAAGFAVTE